MITKQTLWKVVWHNNVTNNNVKIAEPLKHLSNLTWFRNCVLTGKSARDANYNANPRVSKIDNPENAIFQITDTKLYVPVVTLSKENDIKLLKKLKTGFKKNIKWNKYRSQMTIQPQII